MGFLFKSAIGLGAVYLAMFGQALRSDEVGAATSQCAKAASQQLAADSGLGARWSAAGCAVAVAAAARKANLPAQPPAAAPPPRPPKARSGTLSQADLAEPWFGPARSPRKAARRG